MRMRAEFATNKILPVIQICIDSRVGSSTKVVSKQTVEKERERERERW